MESIRREIDILRRHGSSVIDDTETIISEKRSRIEDTQSRIDKRLTEIGYLKDELSPLLVKLQDLEKKRNTSYSLNNLHAKISGAEENLEKQRLFFTENERCPTCLQPITEEHKHSMIVDFDLKITERKKAGVDLADRIMKLNTEIQELRKIESRVQDLRLEIRTIENEIGAWNSYIQETKDDIERMGRTTKRTPEWETLVSELEKRLEEEGSKYNSLEEDKRLLEAAGHLLRDDGMKAMVIKQYVPVINGLINKYLASLDFFVAFELDETFQETIKSRHRDEFSYNSFSEGQKFRINLAVLFTWRAIAQMRNSVSTNLMVMDEVMDSSLDAEGTDYFTQIIQNALTKDVNVIIISHKIDQLVDKFDKVVHFKLQKNFTSIE
jgi:DNA repair exonuclease SbcCD ATPase subunit